MNLPRCIALTALAVLIIGAHLFVTGLDESSRRSFEHRSGIRSIPADSEFVSATLDTPLTDGLADVSRTIETLRIAGRETDAADLQRFFVTCNYERMQGADDACRKATVGAAIAAGRAAPREALAPAAATAELESKLAAALSFFLPDEEHLKASTDENHWRELRYDGPGVLRYELPVSGAYAFVAARNGSAFRITAVEARLMVRGVDGSTFELQCGSDNPYPFYSRALEPGGATTLACKRPDKMSVDEVVAALHAIAEPEAPSVRVTRFNTEDPYAAVADRGIGVAPRFTVEPIARLFFLGLDRNTRLSATPVPLALAAMDCSRLATCPSSYQALAMKVVRPLEGHLLALPIVIGTLLGLIVGGLSRRAFTVAGILAGLLVTIATVGIAYLFHAASAGGGDNGFALLGIATLGAGSAVAFVLGLPAFFLTVALMKVLHARAAVPPAARSSSA